MSFADLAESCEASIKKLASCSSRIDGAGDDASAVKSVNNEATRYLRDAQGFVNKMEAEVKVAAPSQRRELAEQLAQLKASLQTARLGLQKANDGKARAALLKPTDKAKVINDMAHDKLESAANKSASSTVRLQQAQQQLAETADVGVKLVIPATLFSCLRYFFQFALHIPYPFLSPTLISFPLLSVLWIHLHSNVSHS